MGPRLVAGVRRRCCSRHNGVTAEVEAARRYVSDTPIARLRISCETNTHMVLRPRWTRQRLTSESAYRRSENVSEVLRWER
jgi:hypothetical protein